MTVLMIASDNNPTSGAFLSMVKLCALLKARHGVHVLVVLPRPGNGVQLLREAGLPYCFVRSFAWVCPMEAAGIPLQAEILLKKALNRVAAYRLKRLLCKFHADILHINTTYSYVGALAALQARVPLVWHLREYLEEDQGNRIWNREAGYRLIGRADRIVAIASGLYEKYRPYFAPQRLVCVLNGIDPAAFPARSGPILQGERAALFYGGGYSDGKGYRDLLEALAARQKSGKQDFTLCLLGELTPQAEAALDELNLRGVTQTPGYQKDVAKWLAQADIAFNCSVREAFGRKTVEAMMTGALVIAADTGGTLDLLRDGDTGLYYRQGNAQSLADALDRALSDRAASQSIAKRGMRFARESLTAERNADTVFTLYQGLMAEKEQTNA
ncbi:MAG TPA: glycosyltransferase family 4 protein [Candidatus Limiplasma sp.]|nr:glycosyltransferase family 4 protein [Candidatus Limiplasma sp.]HPS81490.1 glycosyltransferase family 4 protein [Candidatus Limiplasma sp.]